MNQYLIKRARKEQGVTLVELVIAIVIISVCITSMMTTYSTLIVQSVDPMIHRQGVEVANSFMEEIMAKPYPAAPGTCISQGGSRGNYDDVCDYNGYASAVIRDATETAAVDGLEQYSVAVSVTAAGGDLTGLAANDALKVEVSVTHSSGRTISISSYRVDY